MDIEKIIKKIVDDGNIEYMHELSDMLEDTLEIIQKYDEECYKEYELELYKMAYGSNLTREMAEEIVHSMKPYSQHWSLQETQNIQEQFGMTNINPVDFYIVLNSAFNDYNDLFNDNLDMYVRFANDFINDEDAMKMQSQIRHLYILQIFQISRKESKMNDMQDYNERDYENRRYRDYDYRDDRDYRGYRDNRYDYRDDYRRRYDLRGGRINNRNYRGDYYEELEMTIDEMKNVSRDLEDISEMAKNMNEKNIIMKVAQKEKEHAMNLKQMIDRGM